MKKLKLVKMCTAAMLAALTCIATIVFIIPVPLGGYLNLGDCFVLASGWILGPAYGFAAGAIGSAMADIFSGFAVYAPATFIIKGCMALLAAVIAKKMTSKNGNMLVAHVVASIAAELVMVAGYYLTDAAVMGLGFNAALATIPWNCVQGLVGATAGIALTTIAAKTKILSKLEPYAI